MSEEKKFYTAKNDMVFKTIFIDNKDHTLMNALLSEILDTEVKVIKYLKNELDIKDVGEREKRVDALIDANGKRIHLELNNDASASIRNRNLIYFEAWHSNETRKSNKYNLQDEYIHIDLTFNLSNKYEPVELYEIRSKEGHLYVDNVKIYVVNMDKIKGFWYSKDRKGMNRFKYLLMLDLAKEELNDYAKYGDEVINDYKERIMDVNENFSFRDFIPPEKDDQMLMESLKEEYKEIGLKEGREKGLKEGRKEGLKEGREEGIKQGIEQGIEKNKLEVIKNLYQAGTDNDTISIAVNMPNDQIEDIIKSFKEK